ncbi:GNAT family acetyltransferase [Streptococcus pneumoniae]|nr:GNAT family acetyltransferase [Streptococcus pneumoniae]
MMFVIEEVKDENQKKAVVAEVLKDLPEWFGTQKSKQAYIEGTTTLQVWTAYQESDLTRFVMFLKMPRYIMEITINL